MVWIAAVPHAWTGAAICIPYGSRYSDMQPLDYATRSVSEQAAKLDDHGNVAGIDGVNDGWKRLYR